MPIQDHEVDPAEALREGGGGTLREPLTNGDGDNSKLADSGADQAPDQETEVAAAGAVEEEPKDILNTLRPRGEQRKWTIRDGSGENATERDYVQKPLSYFGKMEFFGLVGEVIDKAVSGENGLRISSLFDMPGRGGALSASDFRDADTFVQAVGKLLTYAPDFLQKCYCIWWSVPEYERPWVIDVISRSPDEGGLTDDEGVEAIEIFIDQNWEALESFFRDKISTLRDRVQARRESAAESRQSKP